MPFKLWKCQNRDRRQAYVAFLESALIDFSPNFESRQIVYLEHGDTRLYAEVIQFVAVRQRYWVRPLLLVVVSADTHCFAEPLTIITLHTSADLLWPATLFRPALDTEVIAFLPMLTLEPKVDRDPTAQQQLRQFIHQVWQAYECGS